MQFIFHASFIKISRLAFVELFRREQRNRAVASGILDSPRRRIPEIRVSLADLIDSLSRRAISFLPLSRSFSPDRIVRMRIQKKSVDFCRASSSERRFAITIFRGIQAWSSTMISDLLVSHVTATDSTATRERILAERECFRRESSIRTIALLREETRLAEIKAATQWHTSRVRFAGPSGDKTIAQMCKSRFDHFASFSFHARFLSFVFHTFQLCSIFCFFFYFYISV